MTYISDHAVLRYLERIKGIDIDAIRAEMATPGVEVAPRLGCVTVVMSNGARLKLTGDVVSTVHRPRRVKGRSHKSPTTAAEAGLPERK